MHTCRNTVNCLQRVSGCVHPLPIQQQRLHLKDISWPVGKLFDGPRHTFCTYLHNSQTCSWCAIVFFIYSMCFPYFPFFYVSYECPCFPHYKASNLKNFGQVYAPSAIRSKVNSWGIPLTTRMTARGCYESYQLSVAVKLFLPCSHRSLATSEWPSPHQ